MNFIYELKRVRELTNYCLDELRCPNLCIKIQFNKRFTNRMGDARYFKRGQYGLTRYSQPLWPRADRTERDNTVIHEVCHVVADFKYPELVRRQGIHGDIWQTLHRICGAEPMVRHNVCNNGLRKQVKKYRVKCDCPTGVIITANRLSRMRKGTRYICNKCKCVIYE